MGLYDGMIGTMWLNVWGNTLIAGIAILAAFAYLCYRKRLDAGPSSAVILPVLFGMIAEGTVPVWVKGMFLIAIGILWGLAILRISGLRG